MQARQTEDRVDLGARPGKPEPDIAGRLNVARLVGASGESHPLPVGIQRSGDGSVLHRQSAGIIAGHPSRQITQSRSVEVERASRAGSALPVPQSAVEPDGNQIAGNGRRQLGSARFDQTARLIDAAVDGDGTIPEDQISLDHGGLAQIRSLDLHVHAVDLVGGSAPRIEIADLAFHQFDLAEAQFGQAAALLAGGSAGAGVGSGCAGA